MPKPLNRIQQSVLDNFVPIKDYTLTIRQNSDSRPKRVQVKASTYKQAVNIACSRYRGRWVNYSLAKKMDLISARVDAAKLSRTSKTHEAFVILRKDEFVVEPSLREKDDVYAKYKNGGEDKDFLDSLKPTTSSTNDKLGKVARATVDKANATLTKSKTLTNMKTKEAPKKAAKKSSAAPAKKATAAKKGAPVKRARYTEGKRVTMTNKEMSAKIKKGYMYFNEAGVNKTKYIPERPNQDLKNEDYYEVAPQK